MEQSRLVVVDVETSGLNIKKDRLIAIGAVAVVNGRVALADSLEIVL
jgi:DNA polymerase-3 subunit epsilon